MSDGAVGDGAMGDDAVHDGTGGIAGSSGMRGGTERDAGLPAGPKGTTPSGGNAIGA